MKEKGVKAMKNSVREIVRLVGGYENISSYTHCATRLRMELKDKKKVNEEELKKVQGVMGIVVKGVQIQIVIGPKVEEAYQFMREEDKTQDKGAETSVEAMEKKKFCFADVLTYISSSIAPVLPVLVASGLSNAILALLVQGGVLTVESPTYLVFSAVANAAFTFLPILIAVAAA